MSNKPLTSYQDQVTKNPSLVLIRKDSFEMMLTNFVETYGTSGYSMIYSMGKRVGEEEFKDIANEQKSLGLPMTRPKLLKKALDRITYMGWGNFKAESLELNISTIIVVTNNMFNDKCSKTSVGCCFLHGMVAGVMSQVFESEPHYTEPLCPGEHGERCVFSLASENAQSIIAEVSTTTYTKDSNIEPPQST
jgi:predicted hydrocarbon binding protein